MSMKEKYDYIIVGSGLFGAVCAYELSKRDKSCLILEKRKHIGGNIYTQNIEGINVHYYGAHIFHTSNLNIWEYMNHFAPFNHFINSPLAFYKDELYNLPFNMNTFYKMWGTIKPHEAKTIIDQQKSIISGEPQNLEEQAISLVGTDIFEHLIKGYTEKQWGRKCDELPASIIKRLPVRMTYNNNYFDDTYQGIPIGGYTKIIETMIAGCDVRLNEDYLLNKAYWDNMCDTMIYTGAIDAYYEYCFGNLEYRSLRFEHEIVKESNYQGNAVINYTDKSVPYTRIIEHKHFEFSKQANTVITKEYSEEWSVEKEAYYPINDIKNQEIYDKYLMLAQGEGQIYFGGRLGQYRYINMDQTVEDALKLCEKLMV